MRRGLVNRTKVGLEENFSEAANEYFSIIVKQNQVSGVLSFKLGQNDVTERGPEVFD